MNNIDCVNDYKMKFNKKKLFVNTKKIKNNYKNQN